MGTFLAEISNAVTPAVVAVFGTILTVVINRVADVARLRWGMEIEARHRDALHSAIMSGVQAALQRGLTGTAAVNAALAHVYDSVPDAVAAFQKQQGPGVIDSFRSIAEANLRLATR